jgi:short subunit dehydrogenase-like uncharacterized protein
MAIAVYGASGFTGRAVAAELVRRGAPVVLAGRDENSLRHAARGLEGDFAVRAGPLEAGGFLDECAAVVNCAGPLPGVIQAALDSGVHYADSAGEQAHIRDVFENHDAEARRRGVALVPAAGFDYAPGDCLARLAANGVEPVAELVVAYAIDGPAVGASSLGGAAGGAGLGEVVYREGEWRAPERGVRRAAFTFPPPTGRRTMTRYGAGEVITVPRHTRVRTLRALVTASTLAPHPGLAPWLPYVRPAATLALRTGAARRAAALAAREGENGGDAVGTYMVAAIARGGDGGVGRASARGRDYHRLTAAALAETALRLAEPGFDKAGALSPAAAFDPAAFLDGLRPAGLNWERRP